MKLPEEEQQKQDWKAIITVSFRHLRMHRLALERRSPLLQESESLVGTYHKAHARLSHMYVVSSILNTVGEVFYPVYDTSSD